MEAELIKWIGGGLVGILTIREVRELAKIMIAKKNGTPHATDRDKDEHSAIFETLKHARALDASHHGPQAVDPIRARFRWHNDEETNKIRHEQIIDGLQDITTAVGELKPILTIISEKKP